MTNLFSVGTYSKNNNSFFVNDSVKYLIAQRKNVTPSKSTKFIVAKAKGKDYYISSLYPTEIENQFNADYQGHKYLLIITDNEVEVLNRPSK